MYNCVEMVPKYIKIDFKVSKIRETITKCSTQFFNHCTIFFINHKSFLLSRFQAWEVCKHGVTELTLRKIQLFLDGCNVLKYFVCRLFQFLDVAHLITIDVVFVGAVRGLGETKPPRF